MKVAGRTVQSAVRHLFSWKCGDGLGLKHLSPDPAELSRRSADAKQERLAQLKATVDALSDTVATAFQVRHPCLVRGVPSAVPV